MVDMGQADKGLRTVLSTDHEGVFQRHRERVAALHHSSEQSMAKIKTKDLNGAALDWAVCAALEKQFREDRVVKICRVEATTPAWIERENSPGSIPYYHRFSPSTDRDQGMEILEREGISIIRCDDDWGVDDKGFCNNVRIPVWCATTGQHSWDVTTEHQQHEPMYQIYTSDVTYGPTPLIAAMRSYVASKLGAEVEVPDELAECL